MEIIKTPYSFRYCLNPESDEPIMEWIGNVLDNDSNLEGSINGFLFAKEIAILDEMGKDCIKIYINSDGGSVKAGYTIATNILRAKTPIYGYVGGFALSIAGDCFQACDKRYMLPFSSLMIHNPAIKDSDTTVEESQFLNWIKDSIIKMLCLKTKLSGKEVSDMMDAETWMDAETAVEKGFADEVLNFGEKVEAGNIEYISNKITNEVILNSDEIKIRMEKFNLIKSEVIENLKNNNTTMIEKLKRVLNLASDASDIEVMNAAKKEYPFMWNLKTDEDCYNSDDTEEVMNEDDEEMEMDNSKDMDELKNLKAENAKMKAELENLTNLKIINLVDKALEEGKISSTESKDWINLAKKDFKTTSNILEKMVINKKVAVIEVDKNAIVETKERAKANVENEIKELTNEGSISWDAIDYTKVFQKK